MWNKITTASLLQSRRNVALLSASFGVLAGSAAGAVVALKAMKEKFDQIAEEEIAQAKEYYEERSKLTIKADEYSTPESAVEALYGPEAVVKAPPSPDNNTHNDGVDVPSRELLEEAVNAILEYKGDAVRVQATEVREVTANVFTDAAVGVEDFDPDAEERSPEVPYVVKFEEFVEERYAQEQLIYYADDVLARDDDEPVDDAEKLVGNINLTKFGLGSQDADVVYVRNELLELEFEIRRVKNTYAESVGGFIEHTVSRKTPRFRGDDE